MVIAILMESDMTLSDDLLEAIIDKVSKHISKFDRSNFCHCLEHTSTHMITVADICRC